MALSNGSGGYLLGLGNKDEVLMGKIEPINILTSAPSFLTSEYLKKSILIFELPSNGSTIYPSGSDLENLCQNADSGNYFDLIIINKSTSLGALDLSLNSGLTDLCDSVFQLQIGEFSKIRFLKKAYLNWYVLRVN